MAEDDDFEPEWRNFLNWITGMERKMDELVFEKGEVDEDVRIANAIENLSFREGMREEFVEKTIEEMRNNGTYKFFHNNLFGFGEQEITDPLKEIDPEIKDQFTGDDWKYILPFKWFGK